MIYIEPKPPARRSLRNRPEALEYPPSGLTVPLPSIGSTPDPSQNDTPMEEWGTSVPSGAFFKSNSKSSINEGDEEEEEEGDDEESEEEVYDEEGEEEVDDEEGEEEDGKL